MDVPLKGIGTGPHPYILGGHVLFCGNLGKTGIWPAVFPMTTAQGIIHVSLYDTESFGMACMGVACTGLNSVGVTSMAFGLRLHGLHGCDLHGRGLHGLGQRMRYQHGSWAWSARPAWA